ncbi:MAG: 50S ribosomal protein L3 [Anaerolineaceae bacterium]|nr:50S ribosomal protein L3 [Anaerolineaceae bacterium]MCY4024358.1 50S ribosomal protein L3 [Anaerolineaceae bacterium]MDE0610910.1 50S ribosomal protein L3 [Anaerolineaceae bacterium]
MKGIIGKKVGMTQVFDERGDVVPVTVIEAGPCYVTQVRSAERDGYTAIQLGFGETKPRRLTRGQLGHLQRNNLPALRYLREFRIREGEPDVEEGQQINADVFEVGDRVDVIGKSKGRGFQGTIKRHGFRRQPKTHGQSDRERAPGSIGAGSTPGRVIKGMRMAGRMGNDRITMQNLEVVVVDAEKNLIAVKGSIPGTRGGIVMLKPARERRRTRRERS